MSDLFRNPEDPFSQGADHIKVMLLIWIPYKYVVGMIILSLNIFLKDQKPIKVSNYKQKIIPIFNACISIFYLELYLLVLI